MRYFQRPVQSQNAGLVDVLGTEEEILAQMRQLISMLPSNYEDNSAYTECTDDLNRVCPELANCVGDTSIALSQIADNNEFFEVKAEYAKDMVTGFIRLNGATVGCVATEARSTMKREKRQIPLTMYYLQEDARRQHSS